MTLALALPAYSQTWFKAATEANTITTAGNVTYRFGAASGITQTSPPVDCSIPPNCWSPATTTTFTNWAVSAATGTQGVTSYPFPDPAWFVPKELDILETVLPQQVIVDGLPVVVPALPPPTPYPPFVFTPGNVVQVIYGTVTIIPKSPLDGMLNGAPPPLPPYEMMAMVFQNLNFKLAVIDKVSKQTIVFDCTYGIIALDGTVSQNCIAEPH